jgi:ABC-type nitrate/sulfonate/bicarbonate transport system substrate-binding protein
MKRFTSMAHLAVCTLATVGVVIFAVFGCDSSQKQAGPREKITIAYSTAANATLVYIALAKGYFSDEGLDAIPQAHPFGKIALTAVIEGKADLATVADTPIVFAVMNGLKITILAAIQISNRNEAIVGRQDRGIAKPADLKGKKIGVPLGTNADYFANVFLIAHGIGREKVKIIDMKPDEMATALGAGRVDAVSTFNPTLTLLKKRFGKKGTVFYDESLYTEDFCVVAMQDYVKMHPEAIKKSLRALIKAETFVEQNPEEARRLVAEFIKIDKTLLDEIWPIFKTMVVLDQSLIVDLENQTRWALNNRLIARKIMPNYLDFIYMDGLLAVKPEAVSILR